MVLLNELVALKFPDFVSVVLNLLEGVAAEDDQERLNWLKLRQAGLRTAQPGDNSLEDGDEQVEQQDVGKEQINAKQDDGDPLGEGGHQLFIQHRALWLQPVGAVDAARLDVKRSIWWGQKAGCRGFCTELPFPNTTVQQQQARRRSQSIFVGKSPKMIR